jgi:ubiquinone/menaquinone biosynthesis C-methylase UbiE
VSPQRRYSTEPPDGHAFSQRYDRIYSRIARAYDLAFPVLPFWRRWLSAALPHLVGPRVLEASFGTGWLLCQYADRFEAHGIDLNETMLQLATRNLRRKGLTARLQTANVDAIPYADETFDTVLNTMAFSGYPNANAAMSELRRVLKPQGRLVIIDGNYPADNNLPARTLMGIGRLSGDLIRDMNSLFQAFELDASDTEAVCTATWAGANVGSITTRSSAASSGRPSSPGR